MLRKTWLGMLAGTALALAAGPSSAQDNSLTILWAEWDPANYLQQLVNDFTQETGIQVTVETTPWSDFQTKAFTELNAHGDSYDLIVGDSQWLGAGSNSGALGGPHRLLQPASPDRRDGSGDGAVLRRVPEGLGQVLGDPA